MNFTLLALGSALFGAIANLLARTLLKNIPTRDILALNFLVIAGILGLVSPLFYHFEASILAMSLLVGIALIDTLANNFYFKIFEKTEASVATPLLALTPVFTFIGSFFVFDERLSSEKYILAFCTILLLLYFSAYGSDFKKFKTDSLLPALLSSILFGISAIPSKLLLDDLGVTNAPTLFMYRAGLIFFFALLFGFPLKKLAPRSYRLLVFRSLFVMSQWVLLYYALSLGDAGLTVTLANLSPIFVFLLAVVFLGEKFSWPKGLAAVLALGLALLI